MTLLVRHSLVDWLQNPFHNVNDRKDAEGRRDQHTQFGYVLGQFRRTNEQHLRCRMLCLRPLSQTDPVRLARSKANLCVNKSSCWEPPRASQASSESVKAATWYPPRMMRGTTSLMNPGSS